VSWFLISRDDRNRQVWVYSYLEKRNAEDARAQIEAIDRSLKLDVSEERPRRAPLGYSLEFRDGSLGNAAA
jgi:hypothetical protein